MLASWAAVPARWSLILGILLVAHTLLLGQADLQSSWVPIHMAVLGLSLACLFGYSSRTAMDRTAWIEWIAVAGMGFLLTVVLRYLSSSWPVAGAGWTVLACASSWLVLRGGSR